MRQDSQPEVTMEEVLDGIRQISLPEVDTVVAIERGGLIPATIAASILDKPLGRIHINYRDDDHEVRYETPQLIGIPNLPDSKVEHILLVDDVSVTGSTLQRACEVLGDCTITTLTLRGNADLVAFPEMDGCVTWPWTGDRALQTG